MTRRMREFENRLNEHGDWIRVRFATDHGQVVEFVVQYEVNVGGQLFEAMRYDSAHGEAHRHTLNWKGETIRRVSLAHMTFSDVLSLAQETIENRWPRIRDEFIRSMP